MESKIRSALSQKLVVLLKNFASAFDPEVIPKGGLQAAIVLLAHLKNKDAAQMCDVLSRYILVPGPLLFSRS